MGIAKPFPSGLVTPIEHFLDFNEDIEPIVDRNVDVKKKQGKRLDHLDSSIVLDMLQHFELLLEVLDHLLAVRENSELIFNSEVLERHSHLNLIEELVLNIDDLAFLLIVSENALFVHYFQERDQVRVLSSERIIRVDPLWIDSVRKLEG